MDGVFPIILVSICGIALIAIVGAFLSRLERRRYEKIARQRRDPNMQRDKSSSAPIARLEPEKPIVSEPRAIPQPKPSTDPRSAGREADDAIGTIERLQKQATEYKNNGETEKELECIKKCVELMSNGGYQPWIDRLWKELFRLRRFEESDREKAIVRNLQIKQNKENARRNYQMIGDAPYVIESTPTCPKCYDLSQHIYSRSPKLQSEHILPPPVSDVAERLYCDLCGCYMAVYPFFGFDGNSEPRPKIKIDYEELAAQGGERLSKRRAQIEYDWLYRNMPDDAPKSVAGYIKMKKSNSENFERLQEKAEERGYILFDWMERWCHDPIEDYITED